MRSLYKYCIEEINSILERDPAARSKLEIFLCYPGFHAVLSYRLSNYLWTRKWFLTARIISQIFRFFTGIEIHPSAQIGKRLFIDHGFGIVIGSTAVIGNDVTIYHGVTLGSKSLNKGKRHPTISDKVLIGAGASILGAITVGEGATIGCGAIVLKSVRPGDTVVGIPAKPIGKKKISIWLPLNKDNNNDSFSKLTE